MWQWLISSRLGRAVSAALAFVAALGAAYLKGRSRGRTDAKQDAQERELEAHDRINEADTGSGATDAERIKRLQRMGQDWDRH
jgi:hypothetical protein